MASFDAILTHFWPTACTTHTSNPHVQPPHSLRKSHACSCIKDQDSSRSNTVLWTVNRANHNHLTPLSRHRSKLVSTFLVQSVIGYSVVNLTFYSLQKLYLKLKACCSCGCCSSKGPGMDMDVSVTCRQRGFNFNLPLNYAVPQTF